MRELPLLVAAEAGGRSPLGFIFLDSSVTPTGSGGVSGTSTFNFRVNGGQGRGTDILIDGVTTRRGENGTFFSEVSPGPYAFQEFTVSTSQYSAEYGNSSGGVVNFTIKTGTKDFHGEAYFFLRVAVAPTLPHAVQHAQGGPMAPPSASEVTQLLIAWSAGDQFALEKLVPLVHQELHRLAKTYMSRERPGHTL